jgi:HEAT repeat protein
MRSRKLSAVLLALVLGFGCGGRDEQVTVQQKGQDGDDNRADALVREWFELARSPEENLANPRCRQIALEISQINMEKLAPIFEVIADADTDIEEKVLAVATVDCVTGPVTVPWLTSLLTPESSADTRACAVQLLALSNDPSVLETLRECTEDDDRRVRLAALVGLMGQGDAEAREKLSEMFRAGGIGQNERNRILVSIAADPREADLAVLLEAIEDDAFPEGLRVQAIGAVGRVGNATSIEVLERIVSEESNETLRDVARDAVEAIAARTAAP